MVCLNTINKSAEKTKDKTTTIASSCALRLHKTKKEKDKRKKKKDNGLRLLPLLLSWQNPWRELDGFSIFRVGGE
jgi:hypothetical protein